MHYDCIHSSWTKHHYHSHFIIYRNVLYTCMIVSVSRSPVGTSVSDACEWKKIFMKERWTLLSTVIMQPWALVDEWLGWIKLWIKGKYLAQKHWWAGPNIIPNDFPYPTNKRYSSALIFTLFHSCQCHYSWQTMQNWRP